MPEIDYRRADQHLLRNAVPLPLLHIPLTPASAQFITTLAGEVATVEMRRNRRREAGMEALRDAVGGIVGGLLAAADAGLIVYHARRPDAFTGAWIGRADYLAALGGLERLGLVERHPGIRYPDGWGGFTGEAERLEMLPALVERLTSHAVGIDDFGIAWDRSKAPTIGWPVEIRTPIESRNRSASRTGLRKNGRDYHRSTPSYDDPEGAAAIAEAETINDFLARHSFENCVPPRLRRIFGADLVSGGRWYAAGAVPYWLMPKEGRLGIRIDGAPVAEIDVNASQFRIVAKIAGLDVPTTIDPYRIAEVPRNAVKQIVVQAFGRGTMPQKWGREALEDDPTLIEVDFGDCLDATLAAYPFLDRLPALLGVPADGVSGRITYIESVAITGAMRYLMAHDIPALPVFDSLIVPAEAEGLAIGGLQRSYGACLGVASETIQRVTGMAPPWLPNRRHGVPISVKVRSGSKAAAGQPD